MIVIKRFFFILCLFCCGNTDSIELNINNFADLNSLIVTKIDYPKSDLAEKIRSGLPVHIVVYIDFISSSQDVVPYSYTITITKPIWPKTESLPYTIKTPQSLNEMSVSLPILLSYINNIRIPMNKKRLDNTQSIQVQAAINPFNISEILVDSQLNKSGQLEPESMLSNNQQVAQKKNRTEKGLKELIPKENEINSTTLTNNDVKDNAISDNYTHKSTVTSIHPLAQHDISVRPNLPFINYFIDDEIQADWKSKAVNFEFQVLLNKMKEE